MEKIMADQEIRGKYGKLLGKIISLGCGKQELRSPRGKLLGCYDPKANETRDAKGKLIAKANMLAFLPGQKKSS